MAEPEFTTEELANEEWRNVVGYEGWYSVSNLGRVRRDRKGVATQAGRILRPTLDKQHGITMYYMVCLYRDGVQFRTTVHSLVAQAFLGPRPPGMKVNHIDVGPGRDLMKRNNRVTNLEYVTHQGNEDHAKAHGLKATGANNGSYTHPERRVRGQQHARHKLTDDDVRAIRASSRPAVQLAREMGVCATTVKNIRKFLIWKHVL